MGAEVRKVLAVAAMREGKVVTKLLPGSREITLGCGYNNTIAVEGQGIPETISFLRCIADGETWELRLSDSMDAQITSANGSKLKFSDLKGLGIFNTDAEGHYVLKVNYGDQGMVNAGPYVIHFGFIDPPKPAAKKPEPKKPEPVRKEPEKEFVPDRRMLKLVIEAPSGRREIFPNAGIMTIGKADYNTVSVENKDLPRIHTLLEPEEGNKYILRLLPEIKGGVEVKGSVIPFATLIERHLLKQEKPGEPYIWVFDRNVSGVFTIGSTEVFFGFSEPPPEMLKPKPKPEPVIPKKPVKPATYDWKKFACRPHEKVTFHISKNENDRFKIILGIGLAAALLMGAVTDRLITVVKESKTQILRSAPSARVAQLSETPPEATGMGEEIISDMPVAEVEANVGTGGGEGPAGGGAAEGADAAGDVLSSIGFAAYGTGTAGGGAGFIGDLQSAAASGSGLASGQTGQALIAGAGGGGSGGLAGLAGGGGGVAASAETVSSSDMQAVHQAAQVSFSASASGEAIDLGYRNMSDIRRRINVIKMRVQTAYESLLRSNPGAGGTITINFSITPSGSVTGVSVSCPGSLSSLQGTVTSAVQGLNFGAAPEQTGNLPVSVPFNLVPPQ